MRWNASGIGFSRPLRWIVALLGGQVLPFSYAHVPSGAVTRGLRPYGSPELPVPDVDAYFAALAEQGVILDPEARKAAIQEQARALAAEVGGTIPDDPALLDEVTNLVERPTALRGSFEEKYLELPREALIAVMRKHQRYFPWKTRRRPAAVFHRRAMATPPPDIVIDGNEHVIRARFDADYFFRADIQKRLEDYLPRLGTLTFQEKLGSMRDKAERLGKLVPTLGEMIGASGADLKTAERAAQLAKADLATQMVVEMTSLQGIMGRYYALRQGEPEAVADAIFEHWLPRGAGDILPQSAPGVLLALADRLDSLVGLFAAGLAPTASADPFALRRGARRGADRRSAPDLDLAEAVRRVAAVQPLEVSEAAQRRCWRYHRAARRAASRAGRTMSWRWPNRANPARARRAELAVGPARTGR